MALAAVPMSRMNRQSKLQGTLMGAKRAGQACGIIGAQGAYYTLSKEGSKV